MSVVYSKFDSTSTIYKGDADDDTHFMRPERRRKGWGICHSQRHSSQYRIPDTYILLVGGTL